MARLRQAGLISPVAAGLAVTAVAQVPPGAPAFSPASQAVQLDLANLLHAPSKWRLVVTEGPPAKDYGDNDAPGPLTLCLHKGPDGPCVSAPVTPPLGRASSGGPAWEPHYLYNAEVVYPHASMSRPVLLIVTGSLNAGDGDQIVQTQLVAYNATQDGFRRVYAGRTGRNNNQEIRFVKTGPLQGSVVSAEPQDRLPYAFSIVVEQPAPSGFYRQVLRFQSATLYNDGNSLPVIDSEMPNILRRLGLWKPGQPIPVMRGDNKPCLKPTLRRTALWCD